MLRLSGDGDAQWQTGRGMVAFIWLPRTRRGHWHFLGECALKGGVASSGCARAVSFSVAVRGWCHCKELYLRMMLFFLESVHCDIMLATTKGCCAREL